MAWILRALVFIVPFLRFSSTVPTSSASSACDLISSKISDQSAVLHQLSPNFAADTKHWFGSSSQVPACVLEVGSTKDASIALKIIGQNRVPFAVQSGGHASNPGFSSTSGVHISLKRLNEVTLSSDKKTVQLGMGQTWSDVYKALDGSGVNVVGGRVAGPGLGGFTLGGGFSWKTNQHGLTCDTVKSFTLVLPNGKTTVVDQSQPDLFFALKGGLNRFGIVTHAVYYTNQQPDLIYAGFNIYSPDKTEAILNATTQFFQDNTDTKAQIITTLSGSATGTSALVLFFNDGPTPPSSFDPFAKIIPLTLLQNVKTQSFSDFVSGVSSTLVVNPRGTFDTVSTTKLTPAFVDAVNQEAEKSGKLMLLHGGEMVSYDIEPFLTSYGKLATDSAYPHDQSPLPLNLYFSWTSASDDAFWYAQMRASVQRLTAVAKKEGISVPIKYPNYAITGTSATTLYGAQNAARLKAVRAQVDPDGIMELAGGFEL